MQEVGGHLHGAEIRGEKRRAEELTPRIADQWRKEEGGGAQWCAELSCVRRR